MPLMLHPRHESKHFLFVCMNQLHCQVIPGFVWCCISHCCISMKCTTSLLQHRDAERCTGRAVRLECAAPFACESSASDAWALAAHDLNSGFSSSVGSHHRGPHGTASLKANKHLSIHQSKYHMLSTKIFMPPWWELQSQRSERCNNSRF